MKFPAPLLANESHVYCYVPGKCYEIKLVSEYIMLLNMLLFIVLTEG